MKKKFICILSILLVISLQTSCSRGKVDKISQDDKPEISASVKREGLSIYYPKYGSAKIPVEQVDIWEEYIKDKYDIDIQLIYTPWLPASANEDNTGVSVTELIGKTGFVYISRFEDLLDLSRSGIIEPVGEYIPNILFYSGIDNMIFGRYTDSEGSMWGLPLSDQSYYFERMYNKEWIDAYGKGIPKSIEEFHEYAKFIANEDPDGNGVKDTYILEYNNNDLIRQFTDIFRAFGCYPYSRGPVAYDPNTGKIENFILNENFIQAIQFIKLLKDEGLIISSEVPQHQSQQIPEDYKVASSSEITLDHEYFNGRMFGIFLKGNNDKNLILEGGSGACLAILSKTENVTDKVNGFMSIFDGSMESRLDFLYGRLGHEYVNEGDHYTISLMNSDGSYKNSFTGIRVAFEIWSESSKPVISDQNDVEFNIMNELLKEVDDLRKEIAGYRGTSMLYTIPLDFMDTEIIEINNSMFLDIKYMFTSILDENVPVESALEVFRQRMEISNVNNRIAELNGEAH